MASAGCSRVPGSGPHSHSAHLLCAAARALASLVTPQQIAASIRARHATIRDQTAFIAARSTSENRQQGSVLRRCLRPLVSEVGSTFTIQYLTSRVPRPCTQLRSVLSKQRRVRHRRKTVLRRGHGRLGRSAAGIRSIHVSAHRHWQIHVHTVRRTHLLPRGRQRMGGWGARCPCKGSAGGASAAAAARCSRRQAAAVALAPLRFAVPLRPSDVLCYSFLSGRGPYRRLPPPAACCSRPSH